MAVLRAVALISSRGRVSVYREWSNLPRRSVLGVISQCQDRGSSGRVGDWSKYDGIKGILSIDPLFNIHQLSSSASAFH